MLADSKLPTTFWAEVVNIAFYVQNMVLIVKPHCKTPYELFRDRKPALNFMRPFGCHFTILNTLDYLGKFDGKSYEGLFVGYSLNSNDFRVYNTRTRNVEENFYIRFLEDKPIITSDGPKWLFDIDVLTKSMNYVPVVAGTNSNDSVDGLLFDSSSKNASNDEPQPSSDDGKKDDECVSQESGIDDQERPENSTQDVNTAGLSINTASTNVNTGSLNINNVSPTVTTAPLEVTHADFFGDETKLDMSNITTTYPVPSTLNTRIHNDHSLDHVYRNKKDERGIVIRNKARLVAQGYTQEEGIDYDEVFALVAMIEAIRLFLAYTSFKDFVAYQMDVKSAFLYGKIEEEVYVCQPLRFEDLEFPNRVYKVEKALYGLHQALRAWYETLSTYLLDNGFQRGQIDKTLFIKRVKGDILLVQVYVDDIIFGSTRNEICTEFEKMMHKKFQMSSMGELTFFLGLQVTQKDDGIFISQDKYVDEILKKFGFSTMKTTSTPMETSKPLLKDAEAEDVDVHLYRSMIGSLMYLTASRPDIMFVVCACARFQVTPKVSHLHAVKRIFRYLKGQPKLGLWYPKDSPFDLEAYTDSDYAGASLDRKSTTGGCQFLRSRLISWQCKKQTIVANSTTEAEYVVAASCCRQVLVVQDLLHQSPSSNDAASTGQYDTTRIDGFLYNIVKESEELVDYLKADQETIFCRLYKAYQEGKKQEKTDKSQPSKKKAQNSFSAIKRRFRRIIPTYMDSNFDFDAAKKVSTAEKDVSTAKPVSTVGAAVTTTSVAVSTISPTRRVSTADDITMAKTLVYIRKSASKDKGYMNKLLFSMLKNMKNTSKSLKADERVSTKLQAEEREIYTKSEQARMLIELINQRKSHTLQQLRGYSFDEIKTLFETTMRRVNTFVPMESEVDRAVPELAAGSSKRDAEELDQESSKRQKTSESSELAEEPRVKEADELSQEEIQQMMIIVPKLGTNVEALQTKYPIIDWEIYTEGTRKYWKIIRVRNHTEVHHFFDDMLKSFNRDDLVMLWSLVKKKFNSIEPTNDKEREIWVELKRLFEPDTDDELWKLQKHIHDLTWRLYDSCGVHHVSTENGIYIYMLVEKEYPLSKGTLTLMLVAKLLVDQDNEIIARRSQAPKKVTVTDLFYLRGMDVGSFVARLAKHFGLLTAEILQGLTVIAPALPAIDMAELMEAMLIATTYKHHHHHGKLLSQIMPQRMDRLEEDMHEIHRTLAEQREVVDAMACNFSRFCTRTTTSLARMMDKASVTYMSYSQTPREYQRRRVRHRTGEASTSKAQQDPQQPDP
ncbi:putative ribonuclease H-like domain-containing protein [Tanacetum coccineum]